MELALFLGVALSGGRDGARLEVEEVVDECDGAHEAFPHKSYITPGLCYCHQKEVLRFSDCGYGFSGTY